MTHARFAALTLVAALAGATAASCAPKASAGSTAAKIAALKDLRDSGVITSDEYASQVGKMGGGATAATPVKAAFSTGGGGHEEHLVQDPQLGMVAGKVETPKGWRFQSATAHETGCTQPPDSQRWDADSPDGAYGVSFSTGLKYGRSSIQQVNGQSQGRGCIIYGSLAAQDFLKDIYVPHEMRGARIETADAAPEDFPLLVQARQQLPPPLRSQGFDSHMVVNAGRVKLAYEQNGRAMEAVILAFAYCTETRLSFPQSQNLDCTIGPMMITRAPAGQLDAFVERSATLVKYTPNPDYGQRINQLISSRGEATRAGIVAENNRNINNIRATANANIANIHAIGGASMAAARRSSDALHQSSQAFARSMGDNANFQGPNGQTFNASNQYSHTYVGPNGRVLQSNSAYAPPAGYTETQGR